MPRPRITLGHTGVVPALRWAVMEAAREIHGGTCLGPFKPRAGDHEGLCAELLELHARSSPRAIRALIYADAWRVAAANELRRMQKEKTRK